MPVVAAKSLARVLPEYRDLCMPKPLPPDLAAALDLRRYRGRYASAAARLSIEIAHDGPRRSLRLRGDSFSVALTPAANDVFYTRRAAAGQPAFVQFLGATDGSFGYLWDGRRSLRRCGGG